MEFFDVLDCTAAKTGERITRDEAHTSGTWHGAFHCAIVYERGGKGYALFQKRALTKKIAPGTFDVSVGGHYASGEDASIAGPREIAEELGLEVQFSELLPLGRRVFVYCFIPGIKEYEFQDVFLLPTQVQPEKIRLQKEEVDGLLEMEIEAGIELFSNRKQQIECSLRLGDSALKSALVSADQFVPCIDNYYCKLLLLARRYFAGERTNLFI